MKVYMNGDKCLSLPSDRPWTKEEYRDYYLFKHYGITSKEYENKLLEQGGGCAICGKRPKTRKLDVDHNHRTNQVRGILCNFCNRKIIGLIEKCKVSKQGLVDYLIKYLV